MAGRELSMTKQGEARTVDRACVVCGHITVVYLSSVKWMPGSGTYCSKACRSEAAIRRQAVAIVRPQRGPTSRIYIKDCTVCHKMYVRRFWSKGRTCSPSCAGRAAHPLGRSRVNHIAYVGCRQCGSTFVTSDKKQGSKAYCTRTCARRADRRYQRHVRRQAIRRSALGQCETFTLRDVAVRDGWCCHLCGKRVPNRQYAARPTDPTLDHLIPISDGGEHTLANVALAHNLCNTQRHTGGTAQLRLVG